MNSCLFLLLWTVAGAKLPLAVFKPVVQCENPPATLELAQPLSIALDDREQIYILDASLKKIYVWDKKGRFVKAFAGEGEGPGEIKMENGIGTITLTKDHVIVLDDSTRKVHYWNRNFQYEKTLPLVGFSQILEFYAFQGKFAMLVANHERGDMRLLILNDQLKQERELAIVKDNRFRSKKGGGWLFRPLADRLIVGFDKSSIWIGNSNQNWVRNIDVTGKKLREFRVPHKPEPLKKGDIEFYRKQYAQWSSTKDKMELPKELPVFNILMPLDGDRLLVTQYKLEEKLSKGLIVDKRTGAVIGRFEHAMGLDNGFIVAIEGKIALMTADKDGIYHVSLNQVVLASAKQSTETAGNP